MGLVKLFPLAVIDDDQQDGRLGMWALLIEKSASCGGRNGLKPTS